MSHFTANSGTIVRVKIRQRGIIVTVCQPKRFYRRKETKPFDKLRGYVFKDRVIPLRDLYQINEFQHNKRFVVRTLLYRLFCKVVVKTN